VGQGRGRRRNRRRDRGADGAEAETAYETFVSDARAQGIRVATGKFRADMKVTSLNDGPVTIWIDSAKSASMGQ
jgi:D-Tyr-tRNAtyr deacylase